MKKLIILGLAVLLAGVFWYDPDVLNWGRPALQYTKNQVTTVEKDLPDVMIFTDLTRGSLTEFGREVPSVIRFFYEQLNEQEQAVYDQLLTGLLLGATSIRVETVDTELVTTIFERILWDYPEIFWATGAARQQLIIPFGETGHILFMPEYSHERDEKIVLQALIDERVNAFLATVATEVSEFELVLAVYEYLILTTTYNLDADDHQNIVSVFVHGQSVCAGISRAAQLLLNQLGIFAIYVVGDAFVGSSPEPLPHAWNLVRVADNYYHLDVTWGIPNFADDDGAVGQISILYDYFLVNDNLIATTHQRRAGKVIPAATSLANNFFVVNKMFYELVDEAQLLAVLQASIAADDDAVTFKFADDVLFAAAQTLLLDELVFAAARPRALELGLTQIQFRFRPKANLNMITIYWVW